MTHSTAPTLIRPRADVVHVSEVLNEVMEGLRLHGPAPEPTIRALLISCRGDLSIVHLDVDLTRMLAGMRQAIGCDYVERVRTPIHGVVVYVDEEGHYTGKSLNIVASRNLYPGMLLGNVLVIAEQDGPEGPEEASLEDHQIAKVLRLVGADLGDVDGLEESAS